MKFSEINLVDPEQSKAMEKLLRTVVVSAQRTVYDQVIHMASSGHNQRQILDWAMKEKAKLELPE